MQNPKEITTLTDFFNLLPFLKSYETDKSSLLKQISDELEFFDELINGCELSPSRLRHYAFLVEQLA